MVFFIVFHFFQTQFQKNIRPLRISNAGHPACYPSMLLHQGDFPGSNMPTPTMTITFFFLFLRILGHKELTEERRSLRCCTYAGKCFQSSINRAFPSPSSSCNFSLQYCNLISRKGVASNLFQLPS